MKSEPRESRPGGFRPIRCVERTGVCGHSRRTFPKLAVAETVGGWWAGGGSAAPYESGQAAGTLRLTTSGGDRATGYVMSNKIARRDGHLVCTWLDVERRNQWAVVDLACGEIVRTGTVGEPRQDKLHAVFSNTLPVSGQGTDARYFGASHLYSDDAEETWP